MTITQHPKEKGIPCGNCGADAEQITKKRRLPQLGQTYSCDNCEQELYVYTYSEEAGHDRRRRWYPVTETEIEGIIENRLMGMLSKTERRVYRMDRDGATRKEIIEEIGSPGTVDSARSRIKQKEAEARQNILN